MAPKPKLTHELIKNFCEPIRRSGLTRKRAAALVGVDEGTASRWYRRGIEQQRGLYADFARAVSRAEADFQLSMLERLGEGVAATIAAGRDPSGAVLKVLGRRFPDEWGRRDNVPDRDEGQEVKDAAMVRVSFLERLEKLLPKVEAPAPAAGPEGGGS